MSQVVIPYYLIRSNIIELIFNDLDEFDTIRLLLLHLGVSKEWKRNVLLPMQFKLDISNNNLSKHYRLNQLFSHLDSHCINYKLLKYNYGTLLNKEHRSKVISAINVGNTQSLYLEYPNLKKVRLIGDMIPLEINLKKEVDFTKFNFRSISDEEIQILFGKDYFTSLMMDENAVVTHNFTINGCNSRLKSLVLFNPRIEVKQIYEIIRCSVSLKSLVLNISDLYSENYDVVSELSNISSLESLYLTSDEILHQ
ncbi:hypothetical protein DLAC_11583 [Tieghemostelium lacteum]|uniref:Uncharacterized protein n=1 Tax=Tieghemostelium lacteum TaxID=361077 RepID=A0A151ZJC0_TIELA|nr:hypothetical protein DLAC_11583 [Tieghemostelium lacteum]|eukprot:KYQ94092.1 hypothetical protein DLAC_11583 [Tieghemostelium lacteum]